MAEQDDAVAPQLIFSVQEAAADSRPDAQDLEEAHRDPVNGRPSTIVGVLPRGFQFPAEADLWTPLAFSPEELAPGARGSHQYEVLARIKPGLSVEQARADMAAVTNRIIEQNQDYPYRNYHFAVTITSLLD